MQCPVWRFPSNANHSRPLRPSASGGDVFYGRDEEGRRYEGLGEAAPGLRLAPVRGCALAAGFTGLPTAFEAVFVETATLLGAGAGGAEAFTCFADLTGGRRGAGLAGLSAVVLDTPAFAVFASVRDSLAAGDLVLGADTGTGSDALCAAPPALARTARAPSPTGRREVRVGLDVSFAGGGAAVSTGAGSISAPCRFA